MREEFDLLLDRYKGLLARKACADPTLNDKRILDLDEMLFNFAVKDCVWDPIEVRD